MKVMVRIRVDAPMPLSTELKRKWAESWTASESKTTSLEQIETKQRAAEQRREQRREVRTRSCHGTQSPVPTQPLFDWQLTKSEILFAIQVKLGVTVPRVLTCQGHFAGATGTGSPPSAK